MELELTPNPPAARGYPRPQFVREHWLSLDGKWKFLFDDEGQFRHPAQISEWPQTIEVPFPPESRASGIGDTGFHRTCWYERGFRIVPDGGRVLLHLGAVDYTAWVWINDHLVSRHEGGHTPFHADITSALSASGVQTITIRADDDPFDLTKPRGKQDWQLEPHSIWYPRTTGIWQTVWLEKVGNAYLEKIRWTPSLDDFSIGFEAHIAGESPGDLFVAVTLRHGDRLLASDRYEVINQEADRRIILADPGIDDSRNELLWSPERPTLIDAEIRLMCGDRVIDRLTSYTALRAVDVSRDRFMLNGRPYFLRLVLDQGYWPDSLLAAPSDEALRNDVLLAKAMGFNGVRKHQKIEDPRYLYWADQLGLLVWEEMPSAYRFTRTSIGRLVREWSEALERDFSHPCIVVWVPFNESWGVPQLTAVRQHRHAVETLYHLTRTLDATRPVIGNDGWESSATDIIGIHDYDSDAERLASRYGNETSPEQLFDRRRPGGRILTLDGYPHRGQPVMLTEFGGISLRDREARVAGTWGYTMVQDEAAFAEAYSRLVAAVTRCGLFSGFCYTQFADTFQEGNGLLWADRTPKFPLEDIQTATRYPRAHSSEGT